MIGLAAVANDCAINTKYSNPAAVTTLRAATAPVLWGSDAQMRVAPPSRTWGRDGHNDMPYNEFGVYSASADVGIPMHVGDQLRTSFEVSCVVQNESRYFRESDDARAVVRLWMPKPGGNTNVDQVIYDWIP